jgi:hypothetical protein
LKVRAAAAAQGTFAADPVICTSWCFACPYNRAETELLYAHKYTFKIAKDFNRKVLVGGGHGAIKPATAFSLLLGNGHLSRAA